MRYCNPMKSGAVALVVLLSAPIAIAQPARLHPPSSMRPNGSPHRPAHPAPPPPAVPPPASPFAAGPQTYAPHYDTPTARRHDRERPEALGAIGVGGFLTPSFAAPLPSVDAAAAADERAQALPPPESRTPLPLEPPRIVASRGPDTFYVIPGCYAGNRPPNPQRLPKGCDVAKLRTTPVR